jgi:hypothetical protein
MVVATVAALAVPKRVAAPSFGADALFGAPASSPARSEAMG